ncbi:MAG: DHA2 family efflux MFS transporter permease subunit [Pseudomonadota bacterium]
MSSSTDALFARYGPSYRYLVTGTGLLGSFAMVLSATIANVSVPSVMGSFGVGIDQAQWLATGFVAAMTVSQLLNHWMVSAFGARGAYVLTISVFLFGSGLGWFAPNMDVLILARVLQGLAAGIMQPLVMVTLFSVFPADRRGFAMGLYGSAILIAPGIGPFVGGMAIDAFGWRSIFLMPLPFCVLGMLGGTLFMPGRQSRQAIPPLDWLGYGLLSCALVLLMTAAANGVRWGWDSDRIVLMTIGGVICVIAFVGWQLNSAAPLLDFSLWRNRRFTAALTVAFVFGAGIFGSSYVIPVFVQTVQGYSPTQAGLVLVPAGVLLVCALPITGRFADRVPYHVPIMLGLACFAVGIWLMSHSDVNTPFWTFALFGCISQFGLAFLMPSLSVGALSALAPEQLHRGSGNVNFIRQLGGAVGTNLVVVWLQIRTVFHADELTATQTADNTTSREFLTGVSNTLAQADIPEGMRREMALEYLGRVVEAQAWTLGFKDAFVALAVVYLIALIPAYVFARLR